MTETTPKTIKSIDHISVSRMFQGFPYSHHGLRLTYDDGSTEILHYGGQPGAVGGVIGRVSEENFIGGPEFQLHTHQPDPASGNTRLTDQEIRTRAYNRIGENRYDLINNNCEHFVNDCLYGRSFSNQVSGYMNLFGMLFGNQQRQNFVNDYNQNPTFFVNQKPNSNSRCSY